MMTIIRVNDNKIIAVNKILSGVRNYKPEELEGQSVFEPNHWVRCLRPICRLSPIRPSRPDRLIDSKLKLFGYMFGYSFFHSNDFIGRYRLHARYLRSPLASTFWPPEYQTVTQISTGITDFHSQFILPHNNISLRYQ